MNGKKKKKKAKSRSHNDSRETLRRVTQNDTSLTTLRLVNDSRNYGVADGKFYSDNSDDYSTLGAAIANNTHLDRLAVALSDSHLGAVDRGFYDGLKANSSINDLTLWCYNGNIAGGVAHKILKAYQENTNHLICLQIERAGLQNGVDQIIGNTLRNCRNLLSVTLNNCNITDAQLLPIVDAVRGHRLKVLDLCENDIGNAGCGTIATLLADPNCNLRVVHLGNNSIDNEGAITTANSLTNNNLLQKLYLYGNPIDRSVEDIFSNILCNELNINTLHSSNHTLETLRLDHVRGQQLGSLLALNEGTNKCHVAIKKILKYHPKMDMGPFFEWDADGEHTLKALPYVIDWFERAKVAVADDDEDYNIERRKLSANFQFAKAMPMLFVPPSHTNNGVNKKRKRENNMRCILM